MARLTEICRQLDEQFGVEAGLAEREVVPAIRSFIRKGVDRAMGDSNWEVEFKDFDGLKKGDVIKIAYVSRSSGNVKGQFSRFSVCKMEINGLDEGAVTAARKAAKAEGLPFGTTSDSLAAFMVKKVRFSVVAVSAAV